MALAVLIIWGFYSKWTFTVEGRIFMVDLLFTELILLPYNLFAIWKGHKFALSIEEDGHLLATYLVLLLFPFMIYAIGIILTFQFLYDSYQQTLNTFAAAVIIMVIIIGIPHLLSKKLRMKSYGILREITN
mgnify:CR=1 FL=1